MLESFLWKNLESFNKEGSAYGKLRAFCVTCAILSCLYYFTIFDGNTEVQTTYSFTSMVFQEISFSTVLYSV